VEIRLPAVPSVNLGWRLLSVVLFAGLLGLLYYLWTSPLYQVQAAELQGNHFLSNESVNQVLNLTNKPIFIVDPQQMKADLQQAYPGLLLDSSIEITFPAGVLVTIQEREPVIAWEQDGGTRWVDVDGIVFDPIGKNDSLVKVAATGSPPVPVVIDLPEDDLEIAADTILELGAPEVFMSPEMAAAILTMKAYAPKKAYLTYDTRHGLGWHDNKRDWDVYFGMEISNIEEKLAVYKGIRIRLKEDGISPAFISVEHIHAPYYRLEP
jgi:hypothetical protein